jgi:ATP-dependent Clp protease ATP-binding subunit ClpC
VQPDQVVTVRWSPDGRFLASALDLGEVTVWDTGSERFLRRWRHGNLTEGVAWSPDGQRLVSCGKSAEGAIRVWDATSGAELMCCSVGDEDYVYRVSWSPDGRFLASASQDQTVRIWDMRTGKEVAQFLGHKSACLDVVWSADGAFLASSDEENVVRLWDTRDLMQRSSAISTIAAPGRSLPAGLRVLPGALAQLQRVGIFPALALVRDLLDLTGGQPSAPGLEALAAQPGIRSLQDLHWPPAARIGLVGLLLHRVPLHGWELPDNVAPTPARQALQTALADSEPAPPEMPPAPLVTLIEAAERIDGRLLTLLELLGPDAVAADPGLPLRLWPRVGSLPPLTPPVRQLLGLRLGPAETGRASGGGAGGDRSGIDRHGDLRALLPSQWALPPLALAYRRARSELLYRAWQAAAPPQLRPVVLVLDVSPPAFGPVEALTRPAAQAVAVSRQQAGVPVWLVASEGGARVWELRRRADLVELWAARSLAPASAALALAKARALAAGLGEEGAEPVVLLLTPVWYGAEEEVPAVPGLRGLFVDYPGQRVRPALAGRCEAWAAVASGQPAELERVLGGLLQ